MGEHVCFLGVYFHLGVRLTWDDVIVVIVVWFLVDEDHGIFWFYLCYDIILL